MPAAPAAAAAPSALSSVLSTPGSVWNRDPNKNVAADIVQGIARRVGSVGLTALNKTLSLISPKDVQPTIQIPSYLHPLLGVDPISDIPTAAAARAENIKANPLAQKYGLDKHATALGYGLLAGGTALDLAGLGGEKGALDAIVKETDPTLSAGLLQKMGVKADIAEKYGPDAAAAKTTAEAKNVLDIAQGSHGLSILSDAEKAAPAESSMSSIPDQVDTYLRDRGIEPDSVLKLEGKTIDTTGLPAELEASRGAAVEGTTGKPAVLTDLPVKLIKPTDIAPFETLNDEKYTAGRKITSPVDVEYNTATKEYRLLDGANRTTQALANGDKTIPAVVEIVDGAGKAAAKLVDAQHATIAPIAKNAPIDSALVQKFAATKDPFDTLEAVRQEYPNLPDAVAKKTATRIAAESDIAKVEPMLKAARNLNDRLGSGEISVAKAAPEVDPAAEHVVRLAPEEEKAVSRGLGTDVAPELKKAPTDALKKLTGGEDGKSWRSILRAYFAKAPKAKTASLLSYVRTPEFELERLGLAKGAEMLQDAKDAAIDMRGEFSNKIISWRSEVEAAAGKDKAGANTRIFRWLDGKARFVQKDMSATELKVAHEIKDWLSTLADKLNIPEGSRISEYITHIFERTSEVNPQESVFDDPEMLEIMDQPAKSVYDPFLENRMGKPGYIEDTWRVLSAYSNRAARKIAMDPALEQIATDAKKLDGAAYQYVSTMSHNINMRPQHIDTLIDNFLKETPGIGNRFGDRPSAAITKTTRQIFSRGIFGLNFRNALNNLSQGANTYAKLGEKYTIVGYSKLLGRMLTGNLEDLYKSHVLEDAFVQQDKKLGIYKNFLQKLDPKLFAMQRGAELINRGAAYYGAEARALKKGLSPEQAIKYAKRIVRETQFSFSSVDVPVGLNSDLAKTITQTLSYNFKQIEFLSRMAKDKDIAGFIRYSLASLLFMQTIGKIYGLTVGQLLPSVGYGGNPTLSVIGDLGDLSFGTAQKKAAAVSDLYTRAAQLFPAGGQIKKTIQGIAAVDRGRDKTATGKTRYTIPQTTENYIRAALFGKSSLPQAQAYYNKLNGGSSAKTKTKLVI